jgi:hypothetical protein
MGCIPLVAPSGAGAEASPFVLDGSDVAQRIVHEVQTVADYAFLPAPERDTFFAEVRTVFTTLGEQPNENAQEDR